MRSGQGTQPEAVVGLGSHPREVLLGAQAGAVRLPVCDHYSGVDARMVKSLHLQAQMQRELGIAVFDVTLDCEDGAPVGGEVQQAKLVSALANAAWDAHDFVANRAPPRMGVRVHPVSHPAFASDVELGVGAAARSLSYVMLPKVESVTDVQFAVDAIDAVATRGRRDQPLPVHVLIESPGAVHRAFEIAAHPRVESMSFGLMDFVSSHGGAIPHTAMGVRAAEDLTTLDQFHHPLVVRAKLDIASACHAFGKVPSHCVVTEFRNQDILESVARVASTALGYARMWSIHPSQILPIVRAFTPSGASIALAARVIHLAQAADWAPIDVDGVLHDRASFRFFWQALERAYQTGCVIPEPARAFFPSRVH